MKRDGINKPYRALLFGLTLCVASLGLARAAPAGSIIDVVGEVSRTHEAEKITAGLFDNLFVGDLLRLSNGASIVITHHATKSEYSLAAPAELEIVAGGIKMRSGTAPKAKSLTELAVASLGAGSPRATVGAIQMRSFVPPPTTPNNGETVLTRSPELAWPASAGVGTYLLVLRDENGKVLLETRTEQSRWPLANENLLDWGGSYGWSVSAADGDVPLNIVRQFKVIERAQLDELERLKPAEGDEFARWATYGRVLETLGAHSEAKAVWLRLAAQRPDLPILKNLAKGRPALRPAE